MSQAPEAYDDQIRRVRSLLRDWASVTRTEHVARPDLVAQKLGLAARGQGTAPVLVGSAVGAELGQPGASSYSLVLTTSDEGLVNHGQVHRVGCELASCTPGKARSLAQVVLLKMSPAVPVERYKLETTAYLSNRLPGHMARAIPGRLWLRVSKEVLRLGFSGLSLGGALLAAFRMDFPQVQAAEVILLLDDPERVASLHTVAAEVRVKSGQQTKLTLAPDGQYECSDLDCQGCENRNICDALRDITVRYRQRSA